MIGQQEEILRLGKDKRGKKESNGSLGNFGPSICYIF